MKAKNLIIFIFVSNLYLTFLPNVNGQNIGNWLNNAGTNPDNQTQTNGAVGIGVGPWLSTVRQESWTHINWCPPIFGPDEAGLILTLLKCHGLSSTTNNPNQFHSVPIDFNGSSFEPAPLQPYYFTSFLPLGTYPTSTNPNNSYISGVNNGREPLFWARTQEPQIRHCTMVVLKHNSLSCQMDILELMFLPLEPLWM